MTANSNLASDNRLTQPDSTSTTQWTNDLPRKKDTLGVPQGLAFIGRADAHASCALLFLPICHRGQFTLMPFNSQFEW